MTPRSLRRTGTRAGLLGLVLAAILGSCAEPDHVAPSRVASAGPSAGGNGPVPVPPRPSAAAPIVGPAIAFHADPDGHDDFYLIAADGSGLRPLTTNAETVAFPFWSPDGSRIAYLCCDGFDAPLWVMSGDGSGMRQLTDRPAGAPSWSPDGRRIAYDDHDEGTIWVVDADGSNARRLAAQSGGASWSPDGARIVFFSWRDHSGQDQRNELYVMNADGSSQTRLTDNEAEDVEPTWSPDGRRIAFTSSRDGNPEIYVAAADGRGQRRLTTDPAPDEGPAWAPDGARILFTSYRDGADPLSLGQGNAEILTIRPDGSDATNLTSHPEWDGYPAWSPDARQIAYSINDGREFDLYVMNADGSAKRRLAGVAGSNGIANDCCPAWRP
ncbi:MAG TPA: oligogalacturonate lyase family protein [Candidatus Limnocylindrales bacterium]|nr:oligogalacturonate lyase family protein [Candidatus Limnocylindrales bacterium]